MDTNQAFLDLLGYGAEELHGVSIEKLDRAPREEVDEYVLLAVACRDDRPRRRLLMARDGQEIPVDIRATPLKGDRDTLLALYLEDVRTQQAHEDERRQLTSQLWMAQKHEAVGRLAEGIAQDFNNILASIMLTAESALERVDGEDLQEELKLITDAGLRARELTQALLAFSGTQTLDRQLTSLDEILEGMKGPMRRSLPEGIDLVVQPCGSDWAVSADPAQMQQVLLNLVVNARDAMPGGGYLIVKTQEVEVDREFVQSHPGSSAGPHVVLSVTDTGMGMDEETLARAFEPFFSAGEQAGTGLGLSTVYGIVKQSGGNVWITSQAGVGTTVRVYMPRIGEMITGLDPHEEGEEEGGSGEAEDDAGIARGDEHILLVEGDDEVRDDTVRTLQELGYRVTEAPDPDTAIRIHDELGAEEGRHPVDLLLTDVVMTGMSGVEMVRRLRTKREDLRVLYMSGYLDTFDRDDKDDDTEAPVLPKPFTQEEVARKIRRLLDA